MKVVVVITKTSVGYMCGFIGDRLSGYGKTKEEAIEHFKIRLLESSRTHEKELCEVEL